MTTVMQVAAMLLVLPLAWLVRHKKRDLLSWTSISNRPARSLQIIDQVRLTPHHSIHLVRLANRTMVVAVDPSGCRLLGRGRWPLEAESCLRARGEGA